MSNVIHCISIHVTCKLIHLIIDCTVMKRDYLATKMLNIQSLPMSASSPLWLITMKGYTPAEFYLDQTFIHIYWIAREKKKYIDISLDLSIYRNFFLEILWIVVRNCENVVKFLLQALHRQTECENSSSRDRVYHSIEIPFTTAFLNSLTPIKISLEKVLTTQRHHVAVNSIVLQDHK